MLITKHITMMFLFLMLGPYRELLAEEYYWAIQTSDDITDERGAYTHNDRGLETSRTEANGTPYSRTIVTEWPPTLFSPVRITEPDRLIQYTYDAQGRELSQTVTSR